LAATWAEADGSTGSTTLDWNAGAVTIPITMEENL
jgi:hypothetical protein